MVRRYFYITSAMLLLALTLIATVWPPVLWSLVLIAPLIAVGLHDAWQTKHAVLRNFPVIGHGRY